MSTYDNEGNEGNVLEYTATKTAAEFHNDNSFVRLLIGPVGCGKSVASIIEIFSRALRQEPGRDGIRRTRWAVIRNTYPELKSTTLVTWKMWFPEHKFGKIKLDSPISQTIKLNDVVLEVIFISLDGPDDIRKLRSLEVTGIYINELQFLDHLLFIEALKRCDRWPPKKFGAPITWT